VTTTTAKPRVATSWVAPSVTVARASCPRPSSSWTTTATDTKNPRASTATASRSRSATAGVGDVDATEDYYIHYDMYSGIYDGNNGNFWRFALTAIRAT
jgi:hypothetical protein